MECSALEATTAVRIWTNKKVANPIAPTTVLAAFQSGLRNRRLAAEFVSPTSKAKPEQENQVKGIANL